MRWGVRKLLKEIMYASVFALLLTGLFLNLCSIAKETSDKTIAFADDMENVMDCATRGISIYYCSPDLATTNFEPELNKTRTVLNDTISDLKKYDQYHTSDMIDDIDNNPYYRIRILDSFFDSFF